MSDGSRSIIVSPIEATTISTSDSESIEIQKGEVEAPEPVRGILHKWTNYIHGWQKRFFILENGTLAYYKSEKDTTYGCRGAVAVGKAILNYHPLDDCRFDIAVGDSVWYLRSDNTDSRTKWVEQLEAYKAESGYGSQGELHRHGSALSIASRASIASASSNAKSRNLREKIAELETFRDIIAKQIDTLQNYMERFSGPRLDEGSASMMSSNFRGEALTFKATSSGIMSTLNQCVDMLNGSDEVYKKRLEKEIEKRRKLEDQVKELKHEVAQLRTEQHTARIGNPDTEDVNERTMTEEEWHDALDAEMDKEDIAERRLQRLLSNEESSVDLVTLAKVSLSAQHPLYAEIDHVTKEQLRYAKAGVGEDGWQLFTSEGEMKMYKREIEIDGIMSDPLKATHQVKGCTAQEYLHYFFEDKYKIIWDTTLEDITPVERPAPDTVVIHQLHKRVWPTAQRESLFWSHLRNVSSEKDPDAHDMHIVCNKDIDRPDVPVKAKGNVRVGMRVAMVCQTIISKDAQKKPIVQLTRDDVSTRIIYVAQVNPGGWVPAAGARQIYKREYPKFLRLFTAYVLKQVKPKKELTI